MCSYFKIAAISSWAVQCFLAAEFIPKSFSVFLSPPYCPSPLFLSALVTTALLSVSVSLLLVMHIHTFVAFFRFHVEVISQRRCLSLSRFTQRNAFQVHPRHCKAVWLVSLTSAPRRLKYPVRSDHHGLEGAFFFFFN